ncbi:hypothetical protein S245_031826, partial [Arachis hypogaea]
MSAAREGSSYRMKAERTQMRRRGKHEEVLDSDGGTANTERALSNRGDDVKPLRRHRASRRDV